MIGLGSMKGGYCLGWVSPPGHPNHAQQNNSLKIILYSFFKILIFLIYIYIYIYLKKTLISITYILSLLL